MAEMAHIQGDVIVRVTIDENGKVTEAKGASGHPLLLEAAIPAVKQWEFQPFSDEGKPVPVQALVKVNFSLGPGAELTTRASCRLDRESPPSQPASRAATSGTNGKKVRRIKKCGDPSMLGVIVLSATGHGQAKTSLWAAATAVYPSPGCSRSAGSPRWVSSFVA